MKRAIKNIFLMAIMAVLAAGLASGAAYADEIDDNEKERRRKHLEEMISLDNPGYIGPGSIDGMASPYDFSNAGSTLETRSAILSSEDGAKVRGNSLPSYYITSAPDYRGDGKTPKIADYAKADNQNHTGICWVYATLKAIQVNMGLQGESVNLSEKNAAYYYWKQVTGSDDKSEDHGLSNAYSEITKFPQGENRYRSDNIQYQLGGSDVHLDGYLAAWKGLSKEEGTNKFTGGDYQENEPVPDGSAVYDGIDNRVRNIYHVLATDKDAIKALIVKYGSVTSAVYSEIAATSYDKSAWYSTNPSSNHQILIIGWDDGYRKENFDGDYGQPAHDGAWYCMNSWGEGSDGGIVDDNGGFWMSYDTAWMSAENEDHIVSAYDVVGKATGDAWYDHNYVGGIASNPGLFATPRSGKFLYEYKLNEYSCKKQGICYMVDNEKEKTEKVEAVGIDTFEANTGWTVRTYTGTYESRKLIDEQEEFIPLPGFHTIPLDKPFKVKNGESFYIEIEPDQSSSLYCVTPDSTQALNWSTNKSTKTHFGSQYGITYIDGVRKNERQAVIHAYTTDVAGTGDLSSPTELMSSAVTATFGDQARRLSSCYTFKPGTDRSGTRDTIKSVTSSDSNTVAADRDLDSLSFLKSGNATITMKTTLGSTTSFKVTVNRKSIAGAEIFGIIDAYECGKEDLPCKPVPSSVKVNGRTLKSGQDYTLSYGSNNAAGKGTVTVTGAGNYTGTATREFRIATKSAIATRSLTGTAGSSFDIRDYYTFMPGTGADGKAATITGIVSQDAKIASIEGSTVRLKKSGKTYIAVTASDGASGSIPVEVLKKESKLEIVESSIQGTVGETADLTKCYTFTPGVDDEGNEATVSVTPEATDVISVSGTTVHFLKKGQVSVTVSTSDGKSAKIYISSNDRTEPSQLELSTTEITGEELGMLYIGDKYTFRAGQDKYGNPMTLSVKVLDESIATLDGNVITFVRPGGTSIRFKTSDGLTKYMTVTVYYSPVESELYVEKKYVSGDPGDMIDISGFYTFRPGHDRYGKETTLKVASGDSSVASLNGNILCLNKTGSASITLETSDGCKKAINVTVNEPRKSVIAINKETVEAEAGEILDMSGWYSFAPGSPQEGKLVTLSIKSDDEGIVSVADGKASFLSPGSASIIFEASDGVSASISVTVKEEFQGYISEVSVLKNEAEGIVGEDVEVTEWIEFTPGEDKDHKQATAEVTSSNKSVAKASGWRVSLLSPGKAVITFKTSDGVEGYVSLTVKKEEISSTLQAKTTRITGKVGNGKNITSFFTFCPGCDSDGNETGYSFWSNNDSVARFDGDDPYLCFTGEGETYITVETTDGISIDIPVSVEKAARNPEKVKSRIEIFVDRVEGYPGDTFDASEWYSFAPGKDEYGNDTYMCIFSDDPSVASVDGDTVTLNSPGETPIYLYTSDGLGKWVKVKVNKPEEDEGEQEEGGEGYGEEENNGEEGARHDGESEEAEEEEGGKDDDSQEQAIIIPDDENTVIEPGSEYTEEAGDIEETNTQDPAGGEKKEESQETMAEPEEDTVKFYTIGKKQKITVDIDTPENIGADDEHYKKTLGKVKYHSSNKKIAKVNKKGVVTGKKRGEVTITKLVQVTCYPIQEPLRGKKRKFRNWVIAGSVTVKVEKNPK